jgi:hypothetical protein
MSFWNKVEKYGGTLWNGGTAVVNTVLKGGSVKEGFEKQADIYMDFAEEELGLDPKVGNKYREVMPKVMDTAYKASGAGLAVSQLTGMNTAEPIQNLESPQPSKGVLPPEETFDPVLLLPLLLLL